MQHGLTVNLLAREEINFRAFVMKYYSSHFAYEGNIK